uniref:Uncharacterized protein n=1 Tax=Rhizophora mucronata TaxID=61149 RepID=A0A2P2QVT6_RHIMU
MRQYCQDIQESDYWSKAPGFKQGDRSRSEGFY